MPPSLVYCLAEVRFFLSVFLSILQTFVDSRTRRFRAAKAEAAAAPAHGHSLSAHSTCCLRITVSHVRRTYFRCAAWKRRVTAAINSVTKHGKLCQVLQPSREKRACPKHSFQLARAKTAQLRVVQSFDQPGSWKQTQRRCPSHPVWLVRCGGERCWRCQAIDHGNSTLVPRVEERKDTASRCDLMDRRQHPPKRWRTIRDFSI